MSSDPVKAPVSPYAAVIERSLASMESAIDQGGEGAGATMASALLDLAAALEGWLEELDEAVGRTALPWTRDSIERICARQRLTIEDLRRLAALAPKAPPVALADMHVAAHVAVGLASRAEVKKSRVTREAEREPPGGQG